MMKTIMTFSLFLAVSLFFNSAFAAAPKTEGEIQVSCPLGPCWVIAGAIVLHKNGSFSERYDHRLHDNNVGAGRTMSINVRACDKVIMHAEGMMAMDKEEFIVAPCNDNFLPTRRRVHFGDTIRVTGSLGRVSYEVVKGA